MGTNEIHPYVRRHEQDRKRLLRSCRKKMPHHSRKWWKAWEKTWNATNKADGTEEGEQECYMKK